MNGKVAFKAAGDCGIGQIKIVSIAPVPRACPLADFGCPACSPTRCWTYYFDTAGYKQDSNSNVSSWAHPVTEMVTWQGADTLCKVRPSTAALHQTPQSKPSEKTSPSGPASQAEHPELKSSLCTKTSAWHREACKLHRHQEVSAFEDKTHSGMGKATTFSPFRCIFS